MKYIDPNFKKYAVKRHSRFGEYGLVKYLVNAIEPTSKFTSSPPYLVEIGVHPDEGNTLALLQEEAWEGIWVDMVPREVPDDGMTRFPIQERRVTTDNINALLKQNDVPWDFDLFSLDIDGNDYWVWKALMYQPRVVVIEYNAHLLVDESKVVPYWELFNWRGDRYYGASLKALNKLAAEKEYTLVAAYCHNAFFVRNDCIDNPEDFEYDKIYEHFPIHPFETPNSIETQRWLEV